MTFTHVPVFHYSLINTHISFFLHTLFLGCKCVPRNSCTCNWCNSIKKDLDYRSQELDVELKTKFRGELESYYINNSECKTHATKETEDIQNS